eukprot:scaffold3056_cov378-Prasinococcus_capsulatus_cf.AAC.3
MPPPQKRDGAANNPRFRVVRAADAALSPDWLIPESDSNLILSSLGSLWPRGPPRANRRRLAATGTKPAARATTARSSGVSQGRCRQQAGGEGGDTHSLPRAFATQPRLWEPAGGGGCRRAQSQRGLRPPSAKQLRRRSACAPASTTALLCCRRGGLVRANEKKEYWSDPLGPYSCRCASRWWVGLHRPESPTRAEQTQADLLESPPFGFVAVSVFVSHIVDGGVR